MSRFSRRSPFGKIIIVLFTGILSILIFLLLGLSGYVYYLSKNYSRIEDNYDLSEEIEFNGYSSVLSNSDVWSKSFTILTYNIGFGAYDQNYNSFLDSGYMIDGTKVSGTMAKARSYEAAKDNTLGALGILMDNQTDFILLQEVDKEADRSYHINQYEMFNDTLFTYSYSSIYASNFHSAFLAYPLLDMFGKTESGLVTFSKYRIKEAVRRSYPIDESFPWKFFDLDRCFSLCRYSLPNGKEFVLCNSHMSAYDKDAVIRTQQLKFLNNFLKAERDKGNYVIVGGDFNHDIASSVGYFPSKQQDPEWAKPLTNDDLTEGYTIAASLNCGTCRAAEINYTKGINYETVIDGFIISDNIQVVDIENIDTDYMYSDHNPAKLTFMFDYFG